jgi:hypothetical protein
MPGRRRAVVGASVAAAVIAALVVVAIPSDRPAPAPEPTIVADDALLLGSGTAQADAVALARRTGADWLRVTAAPGDSGPRRAALDRVFELAARHRLRVMVELVPGRPAASPAGFAAFAGAIASRYSGRTPRRPVAVAFAIGDGRQPPEAHRRLLYAAVPAIRRAAPRRAVLIGNTGAGGSAVAYARALACDPDGGPALRDTGCNAFVPLPGDGWAHRLDAGPAAAELRRLPALLKRLRARGRLRQQMSVHVTGYRDSAAGGPYEHARRLGEAEWIAAHTPGVRGFAAEPLRDPGGRSGLQTLAGAPRPALAALARALVVRPTETRAVVIWGRVRTQTAPERYRIAVRLPDGTWRPLPRFNRAHRTGADGTFAITARTGPGGQRIDPGAAFRLELRHGRQWRPAGLPIFGARPPLRPASGSRAG